MNKYKEKTTENTKKKKKGAGLPWYARLLLWFGTCAIIIVLGILFLKDYVYGTIYIDASPYLIKVRVNKEGEVTGIYSKDAEVREAYKSESLKYETVDTVVDVLMTNLCDMGYITEDNACVLVTATSKADFVDEELAYDLEAVFGEDLMYDAAYAASAILDDNFDNGIVLDQVLLGDTRVRALAGQYGISEGKAALVAQILDEGPSLSSYQLANMSIKELLQTCIDNDIDPYLFIDIIGDYPYAITGVDEDEYDEDNDSEYDQDFEDEEEDEDYEEDADDTYPDSEYWNNYDNDLEDNEYTDEDEEEDDASLDDTEDLEDIDDSSSGSTAGGLRTRPNPYGNATPIDEDDDIVDEEEEDEEYEEEEDDVPEDDGEDWSDFKKDNTWTPDPDWNGDN